MCVSSSHLFGFVLRLLLGGGGGGGCCFWGRGPLLLQNH